MELIPTIAGFFAVSVDKLLGVDEEMEKKAVEAYRVEFQKAISQGVVDECIRIAREGVAEFPNNYTMLNELMYALFVAGSDDADIPDWKENMEKYDGEIVALGERIRKYCPDVEIRSEATARLAFQHCEMGRKAIGREIYETLPTMEWCRESAIWWALEKEEKLPHTRKYIRAAYDLLLDAINGLIYEDVLSTEESLAVLEKVEELECLMTDGTPWNTCWGITQDHLERAKRLVKLGRTEEAWEQLRLSVEAAIEFDNRPEEETKESLLLGEVVLKRVNYDTADSRPLREILRDKWLADEALDVIREREEFQEILKMLS